MKGGEKDRMGVAIDLKGQQFGKLTALKPTKERNSGSVVWVCQCDCGNILMVRASTLRHGESNSCGCNIISSLKTTHEIQRKRDFRDGTQLTNITGNIKKVTGKSSSVVGVSYDKTRSCWIARLVLRRKVMHNSYHKLENDAIKARKEAEKKYFKPVLEKYNIQQE